MSQRVSGPRPAQHFVPVPPAPPRAVTTLAEGALTVGPGRDGTVAIGVTLLRGRAALGVAPLAARDWVRRVAPLLELEPSEPMETRTPWLRDAAGAPAVALHRAAGPAGTDWSLLLAVPDEEPLPLPLAQPDAARFLAALAGLPDADGIDG